MANAQRLKARLHNFISFLLAVCSLRQCQGLPGEQSFWSVKDIKNAMYEDQKYFGGCYKLLNRTGPVGCAAPSADRVRAKLVKLSDMPSPLTDERAVLVPTQSAQAFIRRVQQDQALQKYVKVVLVYNDGVPAAESAALAFPGGSAYAPYNDTATGSFSTYVWNPPGSGSAYTFTPVPVFRLSDVMTNETIWRAEANLRNEFKGASHWVEAELTMEAVQPTSTDCLKAGTCQPLGGFNVWSAIPPLPVNATTALPRPSGLNVTLVTAGIDSNGFFHDFVQAADAPLSGLLAMLTAMTILKNSSAINSYGRQVVFLATAGEPWGYMGSKRLMFDLTRDKGQGTIFTAGLKLSDIDQVIEVGQIGRAFDRNTKTSNLVLHGARQGPGDATSLMASIESAAGVSTDVNVAVTRASSSNPGLPPSSLYSFLRTKKNISGVYIGEFDQQYTNPYYQSSYDTAGTVDSEPIAATAVVLARTLHAIAAPSTAIPLSVDINAVLRTVLSLASCLTLDSPGMACPLATSLLNPDYQITDQNVSYAVKHYMGVLQQIHPIPSNPYYKKTIYRFLWNYMGLSSAMGGPGADCAFDDNVCPIGQECIGWRGSTRKNSQLMGKCYNTTVRYHPSITTALDYAPNARGFIALAFNNDSAAWETKYGWPPDPLWTESNWPDSTPFVRVYQRESPASEWGVFGGGIAACLFTGAVTWYWRKVFERHLKPQ